MPEDEMLLDDICSDTLVSMIKMAYAFENWEKVISLSDNLLELSKRPYENKIKLKKQPIYYFGYSHLMKGLAYQKLKNYKESMKCVYLYADLSWRDNSEEGKHYVEKFQTYAKANLLTLQLLMGDNTKIPEYIELLLSNPEEILPGIITIVESALVHNFNVDRELLQLAPYITEYVHENRPVRIVCYLTVHYLLALYYCKNQDYSKAIFYTLHNITESDKLSNDRYFKRSIALFDVLKTHASVHQLTEYSHKLHSILKGEVENEESFNFSSVIGLN